MFKIAIVAASLLVAGLYMSVSAFIGLVFYLFPANVTLEAPSGVLKQPANIQLVGSVEQAAPTSLGVGLNVQGQ